MAKKMDAFSASLMADKREIIFAPTVYKFDTFAAMAEEFKLGERDVVLTTEFIYIPFMKDLGLKCQFVFQEKFGAGEPSEAMIQTMYDAIPYDSYDRVIAVGGAIMDYYDEKNPDDEIMKFKNLVAGILGCEAKDAIPEMNALLQRILPLRPLRDCGFTEADFKAFPQSVEANQQRLMTNAYYPFDLESEEAIYRKCY